MNNKLEICTSKVKEMVITLEYVYKSNFNDTYFLESKVINLTSLKQDELVWFDPYYGKSKINNTQIALSYISDKKIVIKEKKDGVITNHEKELYVGLILCEEYNDSVFLSANIHFR